MDDRFQLTLENWTAMEAWAQSQWIKRYQESPDGSLHHSPAPQIQVDLISKGQNFGPEIFAHIGKK